MKIVTLKNQRQFDLVNKFGQKASCRGFILVYNHLFHEKANLPEKQFYFGMKVSKKFAKSAPERNFARRRIRALLHLYSKNPDIHAGAGLIVIPKKGFNECTFGKAFLDLEKEIRKLAE